MPQIQSSPAVAPLRVGCLLMDSVVRTCIVTSRESQSRLYAEYLCLVPFLIQQSIHPAVPFRLLQHKRLAPWVLQIRLATCIGSLFLQVYSVHNRCRIPYKHGPAVQPALSKPHLCFLRLSSSAWNYRSGYRRDDGFGRLQYKLLHSCYRHRYRDVRRSCYHQGRRRHS